MQNNERNELSAITLQPEDVVFASYHSGDFMPVSRVSDLLRGSVRYRNIDLLKFLQEQSRSYRGYDREYDSLLLLAFGMTEARYDAPEPEMLARDILDTIIVDERITKHGKNELLFRCMINGSLSRANYYDTIARCVVNLGASVSEISDILVDYILRKERDGVAGLFSAVCDRIGRLNMIDVMGKLFARCERNSYTHTTHRLFDFACKYFKLEDVFNLVFGTPNVSGVSGVSDLSDSILFSAREECHHLFRSAVKKTNYGVVKFLGEKRHLEEQSQDLIPDTLLGECLIEFFACAATKTPAQVSYDSFLNSEIEEIVKYIIGRLRGNEEVSSVVVNGCIANAYISMLPAFVHVYTSPHITSKGMLFLVEGIVRAIYQKRGTMQTHMSWLSTCMTRFALDRKELRAIGKMLSYPRLHQFFVYCKKYKVLMHASEPIKMNFEAFIGSTFC